MLIIAALLLIVGFKTRWVGVRMAGFSLLSGLIDYADFQQPTDMVMLLRNIALTRGLSVRSPAWTGGVVDRPRGRASGGQITKL